MKTESVNCICVLTQNTYCFHFHELLHGLQLPPLESPDYTGGTSILNLCSVILVSRSLSLQGLHERLSTAAPVLPALSSTVPNGVALPEIPMCGCCLNSYSWGLYKNRNLVSRNGVGTLLWELLTLFVLLIHKEIEKLHPCQGTVSMIFSTSNV